MYVVNTKVCSIYLSNPSAQAVCSTRSICHTKVKELSLPCYLSIARGEWLDSYLSQGYLCYVNCKVLFRIWTLFTLSISFGNHYIMGTSQNYRKSNYEMKKTSPKIYQCNDLLWSECSICVPCLWSFLLSTPLVKDLEFDIWESHIQQ